MGYRDPEKEKLYKEKYRQNNKEKIAARQKIYYENNKERYKENSAKYKELNREKIRITSREYKKTEKGKELKKTHRTKAKKNITDFYIKRMITANNKLSAIDIPKELIDLKRTEIQMKRYLQELKQCEQ